MSKLKNYDKIAEYLNEDDGVLMAICEYFAEIGLDPYDRVLYKFDIQGWYDETYDAAGFAKELIDADIYYNDIDGEFRRDSCGCVCSYCEEDVLDDIRSFSLDNVIELLEERLPLSQFDFIPKELADLFVENTHRVSLFESDGKLVCHITEMIAYDTAKSLAASLNELCNGSLCYGRKFVVTENGMEVFGEPSEVTINV